MTEEYRADQVVRVPVPQWTQGSENTWVREWEVYLAEPLAKEVGTLDELSADGVDVQATVDQDARTIRLVTRTSLNPLSDEVFFGAAYRMLKRIDDTVGRIERIQGTSRELWQPFRNSEQQSDS